MLQMIIYGKIQFLEDDNNGGIDVNNSTDIHKQNKAKVETSKIKQKWKKAFGVKIALKQ